MANQSKYSFSFTGASALITETIVVAQEFNRLEDWNEVELSLTDKNLLNKVKHATFKREFTEIKKRLSLLTSEQLQLLAHGSIDDVKAMILLSVVKAYSYFQDFIFEVIHTKYMLFNTSISELDYIKFFNSKVLSHPELARLTDLTQKKVKQRIFTLLEQVGLISEVKNGIILKPILTDKIIEIIIKDNPALLRAFLFSDDEIKYSMKKHKDA